MSAGFVLILVLAVPILFWVVLIWASAIAGLYRLIRDAVQRGIAIYWKGVRGF